MKYALTLVLVMAAALPGIEAVAKTPKPLVAIELERRSLPWPTLAQLQLPQDLAASVTALADAKAKAAEIEKAVASSAHAEAGESPTEQLEKAQAAWRSSLKTTLALLRPAARSVPQWLLLADLEAAQAEVDYGQAVDSGARAPKLNLTPVEAVCAKAMAAQADAESARQLDYAWALALEARGQSQEAIKHYQAVVPGAAEPWRSEVLYRAASLALAKDPAGAQALWSQVTAMPFLVYAAYRQVTELARSGACPAAAEALTRLKAAPAIEGTSYVEVATSASAACKPSKPSK